MTTVEIMQPEARDIARWALPRAFSRELLPPVEQFFRSNTQRFRRYGRRARAVCPFHPRAEHQNLSIELDRGLYHCFACGESGDLITFVMQRDGVDFREAARRLGALGPVDNAQAQKFRAKREAKIKAEQVEREAWARCLEGLLDDMEIYERLRARGGDHHRDDLHAVCEEGIKLTAARYVLAKLEAKHESR